MKTQYLQEDNTIDVISPSLVQDYNLFFGKIGEILIVGPHVVVQDFQTTTELLVFLGLAQSKGWCRQNGWDRPLEPGYQEITFGKLRRKICILRAYETTSEN